MSDIFLTSTADLKLDGSGDFALVSGNTALLQQVRFRLQTVQGDWRLYPNCGASLEGFLGQPNNAVTGAAVQTAVMDALTHDSFLYPSQLTITVVPVNLNELGIVVQIKTATDFVTFTGGLSLREGLLVLL